MAKTDNPDLILAEKIANDTMRVMENNKEKLPDFFKEHTKNGVIRFEYKKQLEDFQKDIIKLGMSKYPGSTYMINNATQVFGSLITNEKDGLTTQIEFCDNISKPKTPTRLIGNEEKIQDYAKAMRKDNPGLKSRISKKIDEIVKVYETKKAETQKTKEAKKIQKAKLKTEKASKDRGKKAKKASSRFF